LDRDEIVIMSMHRSLRSSTLTRPRNVQTRWERIQRLKTEDKWVDGRSVFGIPKTPGDFKVKKAK
jgi:small basic protein (TIGR04137 family)